MQPFQIGYKALAANLSDLAAMGATPSYYLVAIVIPKTSTKEDLVDLYSGMQSLANEYKIDLIGGDTVYGQALTISITVIGHVNKDQSRYHKQAKAADIVFVAGQ